MGITRTRAGCRPSRVMVTDTAFFRYEHCHMARDTPDRVRYGHLARVVAGLERVVVDLASE